MCGIFLLLHKRTLEQRRVQKNAIDTEKLVKICRIVASLQSHRGPDYFGEVHTDKYISCHMRLSIVDPTGGRQPFMTEVKDGKCMMLAVNGEIYNHKLIRKSYNGFPFKTQSDCEAILPLFQKYLEGSRFTCVDVVKNLDGVFGFVAIDENTGQFIIARDAIGVMPLFYAENDDYMVISSEIKSIVELVKYKVGSFRPIEVKPGTIMEGNLASENIPFAIKTIKWWNDLSKCSHKIRADPVRIRELMFNAVSKRMMSDVPFGVLLSGGLDSSVVAACANQLREKRVEDGSPAWYPQIHTFSIGMEDSSDLIAAKKVAKHLGTVHHEFVITKKDVVDAIQECVVFVETYDVATIRSSIPMYLLAKAVRHMGFKMVLNGDGSDEIFAGYEYFQYAPDGKQLHEECVRKVEGLSRYDCKRANHAMMAGSIECRCPFLDLDLVKYVMCDIDPTDKMFGGSAHNIEKHILREAFKDLLPDEIIARSKIQFSVGCGDSLINGIIEHATDTVADDVWDLRKSRFPYQTPLTKEAYLYRILFENEFHYDGAGTVTYEPSLNCSTKNVIEWFPAEIRGCLDPCGVKFSQQ